MSHAPEPEMSGAATGRPGTPFAIIGTDPALRVLQGTGDPALDACGQPGRMIYVDILDPVSGRSWFGATRSWARKGGLWRWSLDLSLAADTADRDGGFGRQAGAFEVTAYYEETDPGTGRMTTTLAEPFDLTVAAPRKTVAQTDSISVVLARIREIGARSAPSARPAASQAASPLSEDRFVFAGRTARPLTN